MADLSAGLGLFRLILRLYPVSFRERFQDDLEAFFVAERATVVGPLALAGFWMKTLFDAVAAAVRLRTRRGESMLPNRGGEDRDQNPRSRGGEGGTMVQDLLFAGRTLRRSPGFLLFVAGTLALGVGATTAVFSVLDAVVLRPLPYPGSQRMMLIGTQIRGQADPNEPGPYSTADFLDLRSAPGPFEAVVAQEGARGVMTGEGDPERIALTRVSEGYFDVFGARPALGRLLAPADDPEMVALLSHGFWQDRFGGDPSVLGKVLTLDGEGYKVVGVLEPSFHPSEVLPGPGAEVWVPLGLTVREPDRSGFGLGVVGRRREASAPEDGKAHVERILAEQYGGGDGPSFIQGGLVVDLKEATVGALGRTLGLALVSVVFLLLIGCVNVAGLLLARGADRQGELAIRSALGAGRGRLFGQLMSESLLLGIAGGAAGSALAVAAVEAFRRTTPGGLPRLVEVTVDLRVLGFTLVVSLATALLFGLLPAFRAAREAGAPVSGMTLRSTPGRRAGRLRSGLILVETALAVMLTVGSGLMVHELVRIGNQDPGFRPDGLVNLGFRLPRSWDRNEWTLFYENFLERARALPGVRSAAITTHVPFGSYALVQMMTPLEAVEIGEGGEWLPTVLVSEDFLSTMGIRLAAGRDFTEAELGGEGQVAIVNQALVRRYWPGEEGIGKRIKSGAPDLEEDEGTYEVVGVIGDVTATPGRAVPAEMYLPYGTEAWRDMTVVARTGPEAEDGVAAGLRGIARAEVPDLPVTITTVRSLYRGSMARPRFYTTLFAAFGTIALILASVGIYGTTAYTARSRTREIGIRLALGADPGEVVSRMVTRSGLPVGAGVILGLAGAFSLSHLLAGFLFHVPARDPATYASIGVLVLAVGLTAALVPAARAGRIDPAHTLREEG